MQTPYAFVEESVKGVSDSYKSAVLYATYVPGIILCTIICIVYNVHRYEMYSVKYMYTVCRCMHTVYFFNYYCYLPKRFQTQCIFVMQT